MLVAVTGTALYTEVAPYTIPMRHFSVEFPVAHQSIPGTGGTAQDAQTTSSTLTLDQANITNVSFEFEFTDNYRLSSLSPAGASFKVTSPEGASSEATLAPAGPTAVEVTVGSVCVPPAAAVISAPTQEAAAINAAKAYPAGTNGTGDWTIEVTVTRDHVSPVHPVSSSISWTAKIKIEVYSLRMTEVQNQ